MEKKAEVAMEMSDLVVYCQPRSKEKDRFGKHMQMHALNTNTCAVKPHDGGTNFPNFKSLFSLITTVKFWTFMLSS